MLDTPLRSLMFFTNVIALVFVGGLFFSGNSTIAFRWMPMEGDYSADELNALLYPTTTEEGMPAEVAVATGDKVDDPLNYVLWLNMSGFRTDYVDKAQTSFLDKATNRGFYSKRLIPAFPTLRWPGLISQATGTTPDVHGIISDTMRNPDSGEITRNPTELSFLKAEPIWTTAKRQGIKVLVHDWPFSQKQPAEHAADFFLAEFDPSLTDTDRLNALLDAWQTNAGTGTDRPRLIMASLNEVDDAARKHGCRAEETYAAVSAADEALGKFFDDVKAKWPELARNGDRLYVVLSTDHGMIDVTKLVNLKELIAEDMKPYAQMAFSDTIGHVWVQNLPDGVTMDIALTKIEEAMGERVYWDIYRRDTIPADWKLGTGPHIGDLVIQLKSGYAFTDESGPEPVFAPAEVNGQLAASGLAVKSSSRMRGSTWIFEFPEYGTAQEGGEVDAIGLHATICQLLGIEPASGANSAAVELNLEN